MWISTERAHASSLSRTQVGLNNGDTLLSWAREAAQSGGRPSTSHLIAEPGVQSLLASKRYLTDDTRWSGACLWEQPPPCLACAWEQLGSSSRRHGCVLGISTHTIPTPVDPVTPVLLRSHVPSPPALSQPVASPSSDASQTTPRIPHAPGLTPYSLTPCPTRQIAYVPTRLMSSSCRVRVFVCIAARVRQVLLWL